MADSLPTVWSLEPHTEAKHAILRRYLEAWFPILSQQAKAAGKQTQEILFIDGFAGPGEYEKGKRGSPAIALETALNHVRDFPAPIRLLFIEERADRFQRLLDVLRRYGDRLAKTKRVRLATPQQGECDPLLRQMIEKYEAEGIRFGPALAFLDQFGYSAVSMQLIGKILQFPQCEVFSYLDYKDMNRWISDENKASGFTRTYGGDEWREAISMPERKRQHYLLEAYKSALKSRGGATYVYSFAMFDLNGVLLYWLLFSTCHLRGLEEMKKAMWSVDKTGHFRFSDKDDPSQLRLLDDSFNQEWLADHLASQLTGREMTVRDLKEYVLTETPCYLYKKALGLLEKDGNKTLTVVNPPRGRRAGSFSDETLIVRFRSPGLFG